MKTINDKRGYPVRNIIYRDNKIMIVDDYRARRIDIYFNRFVGKELKARLSRYGFKYINYKWQRRRSEFILHAVKKMFGLEDEAGDREERGDRKTEGRETGGRREERTEAQRARRFFC